MLQFMCAKSLRSCPTLCNPMDCSPPGSSVHGILQARVLEWVAMPSSRESSPPRVKSASLISLLHWQEGSFTTRATWEFHGVAVRHDLDTEQQPQSTKQKNKQKIKQHKKTGIAGNYQKLIDDAVKVLHSICQ